MNRYLILNLTFLLFSFNQGYASMHKRGSVIKETENKSGEKHLPQKENKDTIRTISLAEVEVVKQLNHLNEVARIDIQVNPVNSSQEVLRIVPGLFIAQHAGGGKAEQLFLRGFDLDHGTDINISVDGMPVNMLSHAHGQGYADLHFLQPETIESIDFDKGPYNVTKGNLATAGYVAFKTKDRMENEGAIEVGQFNTQRLRASVSLINNQQQSFYISSAFLTTDGYFESPQNFKRFNLMTKYSQWNDNSRFNIQLSHFNSRWNASGQIPQRAVDRGIISRFGTLDDTEGGYTSRSNINFEHSQTFDNGATLNTNTWLSYYDFSLYSNFTFFLHDSINGDEINQKEKRLLCGLNSEYLQTIHVGESHWFIRAGVGFRYDQINDLALYHTVRRERIGTFALGDVNESNLFAYAGVNIEWGKWMINPSVRIDRLSFDYTDKTLTEYTNPKENKTILCPKLNFIYHASKQLQFLLKLGKGFHSNDTRVVVAEKGKSILPSAYAGDFSVQWKPFSKIILSSTLWYLTMQQEFVYVGDEAVVEPSGKSRRLGVDLNLRLELLKNLYFQADYTYNHGRLTDEPKGQNYIPLAPIHTLVTGITYEWKNLMVNLKSRYLSDRPANEDNTVTAKGYFVADLNASYQFKKRFTIGAIIENLFDTSWNEAQFSTETRMKDEVSPVTELHYTPGSPFNARFYFSVLF